MRYSTDIHGLKLMLEDVFKAVNYPSHPRAKPAVELVEDACDGAPGLHVEGTFGAYQDPETKEWVVEQYRYDPGTRLDPPDVDVREIARGIGFNEVFELLMTRFIMDFAANTLEALEMEDTYKQEGMTEQSPYLFGADAKLKELAKVPLFEFEDPECQARYGLMLAECFKERDELITKLLTALVDVEENAINDTPEMWGRVRSAIGSVEKRKP